MAAGDIAARSNTGGLDTLTQLLQTFKGGAKTTTTSSEQVSNEKANALLQQILESNNGLATVSSGQKGAGLYSSSTNRLLTNDLLSRSAANVAALSSQKSQTTQTGSQPGALGSAVGLLGSSLLKPTVTAGLKKLGLDTTGLKSPGDYLAEAIFGPSSPGPVGAAASGFSSIGVDAGLSGFAAPTTNTAALQSLDFLGGSSASSSAASAASGILDTSSLGNLFAIPTGGATGTAAAAGSLTDLGFLSGIGGSAANAGAAAGAGTLATNAGEALTDLGFLEGIGGSTAAASGAGSAAAAGLGSTLGTAVPIIGAVAAAGKLLGIKEINNTFNAAGDLVTDTFKAVTPKWIICTELNKQGRLPNRWYYYGSKAFAKYDERGKQGYYIWAVPAVKHLRKYPSSYFSKLLEIVFNARAEYLSALAGFKGARKTIFGAITTHGLYALCWILSRTIARKPVEYMHIVNNTVTK